MIDRNKVASALPEGTLEVGTGLIISGVTTYAYLTVAKAALGTDAYGPLGVLWAIIFTAGPGFFLPIEQEVSRALASRRSRGEGSGPLLRRAATLGGAVLAVLVLVVALSGPVLVAHLFSEQWLLLVGLLLGLVGYYLGHLARGTVSGLGRFRPYALYIGGEGVVRLVGCVVLAVIGVKTAGSYGIVLGVAPILAAVFAMRGQRDVATPGPDAPYSELSSSLGALLAASVLAQALLNAGVLAVKLLATGPNEDKVVSIFFVGVVVARLPLFLFQAVQAALLPKLTRLATSGELGEFKQGFKKLVTLVAGVGLLGVVGSLAAGPFVVDRAFDVDLGRADLVLLAAGSATYMLALAVAQALIALHGQKQVALSWLASIVAFIVGLVALSGLGLYSRIELALFAGAATALAAMGACVVTRVREGGSLATDDVIEALHLPLEP
ncbi:MAG: lipopolysaccharide biosynthesis protein [Acidimicrobiales bacterium]